MRKTFSPSTRKGITAFSFIMCLVIVGGMAVYYQYMKKQQMQMSVHTPTTEIEKLMAKDLNEGYPETPTEVMKLWGRINQCMYNSKLEGEEYDSLLSQLRVMYSSDLLKQNPEESQSKKLKAELEDFRSNKRKIVSYSTENGKSIRYQTIKDKECAYVVISYFINEGSGYSKMYQDFILVNEDGKWKIMGFKAANKEAATKEEATAGAS